ncbi:MAG TPA: NtaA/DmoA family FMN-dependent monooxygenase [Trebonia sp.]|jgi:FMN-dependent oxidoreductase (nitrilotriacetate monooxygenase family)
MSREDEKLVIGVNTLGVGQRPSAWQSERLDATSIIDPDHWTRVATVAERGTLDALFLADGPALRDLRDRPAGLFDPTQTWAAVAARTEYIGLIATASTTYNDPVELAARFLTLDHLSGGRIGWNAVTTASTPVAHNFGADDVPDRGTRYGRAYEFVELVEALWQSAATDRPVRHAGSHFRYEGVLDVPPSAQGHPVIVQAGGSPGGRRLAGDKAGAVFTAEMTKTLALEHYKLVKDQAAASGRDPRTVAILPGYALVLGSTEEEAVRRFDELEDRGPSGYTLKRLSGHLDYDVSALDLDAPLPAELDALPDDPGAFKASLSFREATVSFARENNLTVRQLLRAYGGYGHPIIIGTPEQVADVFEDWFRSYAADGINIMPDVLPEGLETFVDHVVPLLRARGLLPREYAARDLRTRLNVAAGLGA